MNCYDCLGPRHQPICIYDWTHKQNAPDYFCFSSLINESKQEGSLIIIEDYFGKSDEQESNPRKSSSSEERSGETPFMMAAIEKIDDWQPSGRHNNRHSVAIQD